MHPKKLFQILIALALLLCAGSTLVYSQSPQPQVLQAVLGESSISPMAAVPGGPGYLMIPASAFNAFNNAAIFERWLVLRTNSASPAQLYYAPVNLPNGATVTRMVYYFRDNDTTKNTYATLFRFSVPGDVAYGMVTVYSPSSTAVGDSFGLATDISYSVIDNQANSYFVEINLPAGTTNLVLWASSVRIDYQYSSSLPALSK